MNELISWIRFNKRQALATNDGLYTKCSGNPEVPGWLGRLFVSSTKSSQQAEQDAKKLLSSSGAVIITSKTEGKSQWVRAGQVYERLALTMMSRDVKTALLNQPIEMRGLRGQFQSALGLGDATPELLLRFGYAANLPMSLRRPVEDVLVQG